MSQSISAQDDVPSGDEVQRFEQEFGPFDPPPRYQFEPEFSTPAPRPIPPELYRGPYFHQQRMVIIGMFSAGIALLVCYAFPFVRLLGLYVLPLQYLHWVAVALVVMSCLVWVSYLLFRGPLVYVEGGVPLVARIVDVFLRVKMTMGGVPTLFEYVVTLQHRDPQTGELVFSSAKHDVAANGPVEQLKLCVQTLCQHRISIASDGKNSELFDKAAAKAKDRITLSYQVGDYVTAVYLRRNPAKSLRLYGFLDIRPNLGIIPRGESKQWTVMQLITTIGAFGGLCVALGWAVYAFGKFTPLEVSFSTVGLPFATGAVLFGGGWLRYLAWRARKARNTLEESHQAAAAGGDAAAPPLQPKAGLFGRERRRNVFCAFSILTLGGVAMVFVASTVNALFDSSPTVLRPVHIREMWMITHEFVFREYKIEYELADDPAREKHELMTTPSHMESFGPVRNGFARVRRGFLGWPWVETITPLQPNAPLVPPAPPPPGGR